MNPRTKKFTMRKCIVCGYPFSDRHHLYPQVSGGSLTIGLCPNHHRFANMLQVIISNGGDDSYTVAEKFAHEHFDEDFNTKVLDLLLQAYAQGVFYNDLLGFVGTI